MFLYWRDHNKCFTNGFDDLKQGEIEFNNLCQELIFPIIKAVCRLNLDQNTVEFVQY